MIAGLGLRAGADGQVVATFLRAAHVAPQTPICIPDWLRSHDAVRVLAAFGWTVRLIPADDLRNVPTPTQSPRILARYGTGSIAEACALVGAGPSARLVAPSNQPGSYDHAGPCPDRRNPMTIHFIGTGPGAADLLTLRGRDLIAASPVCLYAGSLIPEAVLAHCPPGATMINTAPMDLDGIIATLAQAHERGQDVARLHSGDLSIWSAMGEQLRRLDALDIPYDVTPGVPSFAAAAASLRAELTLPGVAQSLVLTRVSGRASPMPAGEDLENFARTGTTLALHLSIHRLDEITQRLIPFYGPNCPVAVVWRASWPDERIVVGTLSDIAIPPQMERTALILVGPAIGARTFDESRLYASDYDRRFRAGRADAVSE